MTEAELEIERMYMERLDEECAIDVSEKIEYPPVAISMGEYTMSTQNGSLRFPIPIGTYGNFSFISGQPKTKKSFFVSLLNGVYLSKSGQNKYGDTIKGNREGRCAVHFDTEQGKFHAQRVFRRPFAMNETEEVGCYHTYGLRPIGYKDRIKFIDYKLKQIIEQGQKIGLVTIDGIADLVSDANNIEESNLIVQKVMTWSSIYDCHIMLVVHTNFGSTKATGHLGSFLQKKCETEILLEANEDESIAVKCNRSRNYSFKEFSFEVSKKGLPYVTRDLNDTLSGVPNTISHQEKLKRNPYKN
jgi:hypothetical protein